MVHLSRFCADVTDIAFAYVMCLYHTTVDLCLYYVTVDTNYKKSQVALIILSPCQ
jgi:hypothetical protein